ncbi:MAG: hypothetical protein ACKVRN_17195 [Pyrinomonadaceae bacterium]
MKRNRICRTTPNRHPQFFIRRSEIAFDEKVRYVESVCQVLIESRFGPGCVDPVVIDLSDRPEPGAAVFYDLSENGEMVPCYALSPHRRAGFQVVEAAYRRAKQMGLVTTRPSGHNLKADTSPNQGRGSP